jgi:hypothetical protein
MVSVYFMEFPLPEDTYFCNEDGICWNNTGYAPFREGQMWRDGEFSGAPDAHAFNTVEKARD